MHYTVGLDVHKHETQACIATPDGTVIETKRFRTRRVSYRKALAKYADADVIIESVGFHRPVAKWLTELGATVRLAHVGDTKRPRIKTDERDALNLVKRFRVDALTMAYLPAEEVQKLRDLARHRRFLGEQSTRFKTKIKHDLLKHGHFLDADPLANEKSRAWLEKLAIPEVTSSLRMVELVQEQIKDYETKLEAHVTTHPLARLVETVPGIGSYLATLIVAEVADFDRFEDKDDVGAYAGLVPSRHQSGDHDRSGHITKRGNDVLRWALVEAAHHHVRVCPESKISERHKRLAERIGSSKAWTATARHLGGVLWTLVKTNTAFRVNPHEPVD
ncbi:MAG: IS110 family transposase [Actinobacteria bacterium]|nr:IS110 family transposase [Actinomycetota bacterium]